jgi:uncharacterized protein
MGFNGCLLSGAKPRIINDHPARHAADGPSIFRVRELKLQPDRIEGVNVISGLLRDAVSVNGITYRDSIAIPWVGDISPWGEAGFEGLTVADFDRLAELQPELVIFGSGARLRFPPPGLLRNLMARRIGIETMDTAAACRTYNVLAGESRRVIAALLLG